MTKPDPHTRPEPASVEPSVPALHATPAVDRRRFLRISSLAGAAGICGGGLWSFPGHALTEEERARLSPREVLSMMQAGNERFRTGVRRDRSFLDEQREKADGQFPAAIVLSCIDSRAPAEVIMDLGIGDVFNSRVAGNVVNDDVLGGMEFACQVAGAKVILVMGHTSCGAVKGAVDDVELGYLTGLLTKIRPAVVMTEANGPRTSKNLDFVDAVARNNVKLAMDEIPRRSEVLRQLEADGAILIAGAMYDLQTAATTFFTRI